MITEGGAEVDWEAIPLSGVERKSSSSDGT
jgi:hypothetical protein